MKCCVSATFPMLVTNIALRDGGTECPNCHLGYFTPDLIALSLPRQVLVYILDYLQDTDKSKRKPVHEASFHPLDLVNHILTTERSGFMVIGQ